MFTKSHAGYDDKAEYFIEFLGLQIDGNWNKNKNSVDNMILKLGSACIAIEAVTPLLTAHNWKKLTWHISSTVLFFIYMDIYVSISCTCTFLW
jgi:hypothetical protein